jgi:hypothetical protein
MAEQPAQGMLSFLYHVSYNTTGNWRTLFSGDKESCEQVMKQFGLTDDQIAAVHAAREATGDDRAAKIAALDQQILKAISDEITDSFDSVW